MKREWLLMPVVGIGTLALALGVIRWMAPDLLGIPTDRQVVQLSREVPAFFDNVFRPEDRSGRRLHISDPVTSVRQRPLVAEANFSGEHGTMWGPLDVLGFRNRATPVTADVVVIGDSQTFGSNVPLDFNWPSYLERALSDRQGVVYSMAVGGWGGIQYMDMFAKALAFQPRTVVVAYYTGNDPIDSLNMAYRFAPWKSLRTFSERPALPPSAWPPTPDSLWEVVFPDGNTTVFTAATRLAPNHRDYPGIREGYAIMAKTAQRMAQMAVDAGIEVIFTIVPTKETVFAQKVRAAGITPPPDYATLIEHEAQNITELATAIQGLPGAHYVDLVTPLQRATLGRVPLYLPTGDGHPIAPGYARIAEALAPAVTARVPPLPPDGLVALVVNEGKSLSFGLIRGRDILFFTQPEWVAKNGWQAALERIQPRPVRDVASFTVLGVINRAAPERYGPPRLNTKRVPLRPEAEQ